MSTYTLERWGDIFQVLELEAQQTPLILPACIKISKGEGVKVDKQVFPLIESAPEELLLSR